MKKGQLAVVALGLLWAASAWAATVGAPAALVVPTENLKGKYAVSWTASVDRGASYLLEEATDLEAGDWSPVTPVPVTKTRITVAGRQAGKTYHYRVKAQLAGYEDSAWVQSDHGCDVPYVVSTKNNAGGVIEGGGKGVKIPVGESRSFPVTPAPGYHIVSVLVDGVAKVDASDELVAPYSYTAAYEVRAPDDLTDNAQNRHLVAVKFKVNSYTATASVSGSGGKITPTGEKVYKHGKQATYTIQPESGYRVASVLVNGEAQAGLPASGAYKLSLVITDGTAIEASFASTSDPGDTAKYFPYEQGNVWNYRATLAEDDLPVVHHMNGLIIAGTKLIDGKTATIFTETNPENFGYAVENYRLIAQDRVTYLGNNDPDDLITNEIVPYDEIKYPLLPGAKLVQVDNKSIEYRDDLDGDGKFESARVYSESIVIGYEPVVGVLGVYDDCVRIRENVNITLKLSRSGASYKVNGTQDAWFCADIGLARRTSTISSSDFLQTGSEELIGYRVGSQQKGILPEFRIVDEIAPSNSDTESPGRPTVASDGTNFLVVSQQVADLWTSHNIGLVVASNGEVLRRFDINPPESHVQKGSNRSAAAFDGTNYLVVHGHEGKIYGQRVSTAGDLLDGPEGFAISTDNPSGATNFNPAVAFDGNNYLVVWGKYDPTYICENSLCVSKGYDIYGARVTLGGVVLGEFPVCTAAGDQTAPSIAFDGVNYFVVWIDPRNATAPFWDNSDIYGSRVSMDGFVLDPQGLPIATAVTAQSSPHILFDGMNYFVVWEDLKDGFPYLSDIRGTRMSVDGMLLDGTPDSGGLAINTAPFPKGAPWATFDGHNYLVTWPVGSYSIYPPAGIYLARVSPEGSLVNGPPDDLGLFISSPPENAKFIYPVIHFNGVGSLLAWENNLETMATTKDIRGVFIVP